MANMVVTTVDTTITLNADSLNPSIIGGWRIVCQPLIFYNQTIIFAWVLQHDEKLLIEIELYLNNVDSQVQWTYYQC